MWRVILVIFSLVMGLYAQGSKLVQTEKAIIVKVPGEALVFPWNSTEWKIVSTDENENIFISSLVPKGEDINSWTSAVNIFVYKGSGSLPFDKYKEIIYNELQKATMCEKAKLSVVERGNTENIDYQVLKMECISNNYQEVGIYFTTKSDAHFYSIYIAKKSGNLSDETIKEWIGYLKNGVIISEEEYNEIMKELR